MTSNFDLSLSLTTDGLSRNNSLGTPLPRFEYNFDKKDRRR